MSLILSKEDAATVLNYVPFNVRKRLGHMFESDVGLALKEMGYNVKHLLKLARISEQQYEQ